jgi:aspartate aminotransferase/aminotransferase
VLMLNSPSNPTGVVMSQAEVDAAVEIARRHDLLIVSDEIYEPFLYGSGELGVGSGEAQTSASLHTPHSTLPTPLLKYDKTLVLRGFSKSHAMTGWRLGYAFGYEPIVSQMAKLQQYTFVCAPTPMQYAAVAAIDVDMSEHVEAYRKKRDIVHSMLSRKFQVERPGGAFYIFPEAPAGRSATDFCTAAIERNVLIIPGSVFSSRDTHFRISYATTDTKLAEGCEILLSMA